MKLSRGAQRCLKLLRWYAAHFQEVFPYRSTIAKHLSVTSRQVDRYISELKKAGLVNVSQAGPQPATYQVVAGQNVEGMSKLRRSNVEASRRSPYIVSGTAEEIWHKFPMQTETPSPDVAGLLEWAETEGYPVGNGAELDVAEQAWKLRKGPGSAKALAKEAHA